MEKDRSVNMDGHECCEIILETEPISGIHFDVHRISDRMIIIRAKNNITSEVCPANYANPPIPKGYKYVLGEWNNGFVIERCSDKSQFGWIPVGSLAPNGTLDGKNFSEKFGRRNYRHDVFSDDEYNEALNGELLKQLESVKKYGGFYLSRYNISKSSEGKPQSVKGVMPWVYINFDDAKKIASTIEDNEAVKSHLTFGAEYDSVLEWCIKTKVETGSREKWCDNNIYDFTGIQRNMNEWTQERHARSSRVIRGCFYNIFMRNYRVGYRFYEDTGFNHVNTGFRAALCIK